MVLTRENAWKLLCSYNESAALRRHALAVEAVMRYFAAKQDEDVEYWGNVGLLHDLDYERFPEEHCKKSAEILRENGIADDVIHAVESHGWGICSDVKPCRRMEMVLYATDELTGLIHAAAIMRPSRSILDLELKSVKKKYKDKHFAAGVDRSVIEKGAEMMGVTVDELILSCIEAMRCESEALELKG